MENTQISWCDNTFNPWIGCTHKSAGCANCYAKTLMDDRYGRVKWGAGQLRERTSDNNWMQPLKWNRQAEKTGIRTKVFCASLSDWLDHEVPVEWLADLLILIEKTPNVDWLLLTKRIEQWSDRLHQVVRETHDGADDFASTWLDGNAPENVWLGTTVENQKAADDRIPLLLKTPAVIRFLSVEPQLEEIYLPLTVCERCSGLIFEDGTCCPNCLRPCMGLGKPDWIICGGESGSGARLFNLNWARSLRRQCKDAEIAYFFKQAGSNAIDSSISPDRLKLKDKKGGDLGEMPVDLQIREFPTVRNLAHV